MQSYLANKNIILGITGSIAAYKSAEIVRRLREVLSSVRVVMTENAKRFITPLTMQAVSGYPVHDNLFDVEAEAAMGHIELARWADAILVAPASADFMARLASGRADDLLTTLCLASKAPLAVAPAMNQGMWNHELMQHNLHILKQKGVHMLGPGEGSQACGDVGPGRMMEPDKIVENINALFATGKLGGLKVLVTAGPTHEAIDPVRFITNGSSGKMGYELATAAHEAGADVTLISGPTALPRPQQITCEPVVSALEMYEAVMKHVKDCDVFISVAAVGDYRLKTISPQKIHKNVQDIALQLTRNPDIIQTVGEQQKRPFIVGFAAETENVIEQARLKRQRKKMDMIVANQVGVGFGMGSDENEVTVVTAEREITLPRVSKQKLARQLITMIAENCKPIKKRKS